MSIGVGSILVMSTTGVVSIGVMSLSEAGLGAKPVDVQAEEPALPAEVTGRLGAQVVLGAETGAIPAAGCGEDLTGSGAPRPKMASVLPDRALLMRRQSALFSSSMSSGVTL